MMEKSDRILVTGTRGMVGKHLVAALAALGYTDVHESTADLLWDESVNSEFGAVEPLYVFHAAARVHGIAGNMKYNARSFLENSRINTNVIEACREAGVRKIVAVGTVAMYPANDGAIVEGLLWDGQPHDSEYGYGHSKRHMLAQLECYKRDYGLDYACAISTNLYGPHDRFDVENGHVIPSLVRKFYEAKRDGKPVSIWGNGCATRDFLYVKDAVRALIMMMDHGEGSINLATGDSYKISQVARLLAIHSGQSLVEWDETKPVGQKCRQYDVSKLRKMSFYPEYSLESGLKETYDWYCGNEPIARK